MILELLSCITILAAVILMAIGHYGWSCLCGTLAVGLTIMAYRRFVR